MKHTSLSSFALSLLFLSGRALAQNCVATALAVIPSCAQNCILNGAPSIGCGGTDFDCQCQQTAALYAAVEGCVQSSCPTASYQAVIDGASTGMFETMSSHSWRVVDVRVKNLNLSRTYTASSKYKG